MEGRFSGSSVSDFLVHPNRVGEETENPLLLLSGCLSELPRQRVISNRSSLPPTSPSTASGNDSPALGGEL